jgi:flagellin-like protein
MNKYSRLNDKAVSPVIAIILMVAITVVLASVLYVWVMNLADTDDTVERFPTINLSIIDDPAGDEIKIKMTSGNPIEWTKYKMLIFNQSDNEDTATLLTLTGQLNSGETMSFNSTTPGFSDINYEQNEYYTIEIYNIKLNKQVFYKNNIICTVDA